MVLISTYVGMGIKSVQLPLSGLVNVVDRELAGQVDWVSACLSSPSYTVVHNIEETNNQVPSGFEITTAVFRSRKQYTFRPPTSSLFLDQ